MKAVRNLIIGGLFGLLAGWALGYLRVPHVSANHSFWVGFGACLAAFSFLIAIRFAWQKQAVLDRIGKKKSASPTQKTPATVGIFLAILIALGSIAGSIFIYRQNDRLYAQTQTQAALIQQQEATIDSLHQGDMGRLMADVLANVSAEVRAEPAGKISDATTARVAALSYSLRPYRYFRGDSLAPQALSPERGQLLLALSVLELDSAAFAAIKAQSTFAQADLRGANFAGRDLSGANLQGAVLKDGDLTGANLNGADLRKADLSTAVMNGAQIRNADLRRADLSRSEMEGVDFRHSILDGVNFSSANLRKADLREANFIWANASNAMFNEARLVHVDMLKTIFTQANFTGADLSESNLRHAALTDANFTGANLTHTTVLTDDWLEKLAGWQVTGHEAILQHYVIEADTSGRYEAGKFRLKPVL